MAWAYFQNTAAFAAYHDAVCADLGVPRPGRIQSTQAPAILHQWTDAWVDPIQLKAKGNVRTWAAHIPDAHLVTYAAYLGITLTDEQVVFNEDGTVTVDGTTYTRETPNFTWRKAKPATWTEGNITYDTTTGEPI